MEKWLIITYEFIFYKLNCGYFKKITFKRGFLGILEGHQMLYSIIELIDNASHHLSRQLNFFFFFFK